MSIYNIISKLIENSEKITIFEIGSRKGEDSLQLINLFDQGTFHLFEPLESNFQILENKTNNRESVFVNQVAVGATNGTVDFWVSSDEEGFNGSSSIKKPKEHLLHFPHVSFNKTDKTKIVTLDNYVKNNNIKNIDFIYSDIQGAELDMIKGGQHALKTTRYLYTEVYEQEMYEGQPKLEELIEALPGEWTIVEKWPNDVLLKNEDYSHD